MGRFRGGVAAILVGAGIAGAALTLPGSAGCEFPDCFPDASNTGVPSGTSLTTYSGPTTISTNGTVIDGKIIDDCLTVTGTNVTIRNSQISCSPGGGFNAINHNDDGSSGGPLVIEDSEIDCEGTNANGVGEADITLRRVDISGCENGCSINRDFLMEDSYVHDLASVGGDPHEDGCQMGQGHFEGGTLLDTVVRFTLRHNTIEGINDDDSLATSAVISHNQTEDILIEENLLSGGAYTLYCTQPGTGDNFQVLNNHFDDPVWELGGRSSGCSDETQSGNVLHDTGDPLTLD